MPSCFSGVQIDLDPEVTTRRSRIVVERHRTSTSRKIPVPVVFPPPPPVYPSPECQFSLQSQCTHTETQVIVAEPQERAPEPTQTILNINIGQTASEIGENLATENMLRNQVAVLESSLEEERRARVSEGSARYEREVREIFEGREARRRSRSGGEHRKSRSKEVHTESSSREVSVGYAAEEEARRRISHEYHRSSSHSRHASPRSSGDRLMIMPAHSSPRHSGDRLVVSHSRSRSHEIRVRCSFCDRHGHESSECPEGEPELVRVPVRRVRYWAV